MFQLRCLLLPIKHEALSSDPLDPHKRAVVPIQSHNPGAVEKQWEV